MIDINVSDLNSEQQLFFNNYERSLDQLGISVTPHLIKKSELMPESTANPVPHFMGNAYR